MKFCPNLRHMFCKDKNYIFIVKIIEAADNRASNPVEWHLLCVILNMQF